MVVSPGLGLRPAESLIPSPRGRVGVWSGFGAADIMTRLPVFSGSWSCRHSDAADDDLSLTDSGFLHVYRAELA